MMKDVSQPSHKSRARQASSVDLKNRGNVTDAADKIIVALDVATAEEALALAGQLQGRVSRFKVGLQLYTAAGPEVIRTLVRTGAKVFLDLKLHDIPNTVASAVKAAVKLDI